MVVVVFVAGATKNGRPMSADCTVARGHEAKGTGDYAHALAALQRRGWRSVKQSATGSTQRSSLVKGGWTIQLDYDPPAGQMPTPTLEVIASDDFC